MPIQVHEHKVRSWAVDVTRDRETRLSAASVPDGPGKAVLVTATAVDIGEEGGGDIVLELTADEFSSWAQRVLANLQKDGWRPKRTSGGR
jgi:hypothetical protein